MNPALLAEIRKGVPDSEIVELTKKLPLPSVVMFAAPPMTDTCAPETGLPLVSTSLPATLAPPLDEYDLAACPTCGFVFPHPQPEAAALQDIHGSLEYFQHPYFERRRGSDSAPDAFTKLLARIRPFGPFSRTLDIGCGTGELMLFMREHFKCECHGVDISKHAVEHIPRRQGIHPFLGDVREAPFEADTFDLVVMIDLIEHVNQPLEVMTLSIVFFGFGVTAAQNRLIERDLWRMQAKLLQIQKQLENNKPPDQ